MEPWSGSSQLEGSHGCEVQDRQGCPNFVADMGERPEGKTLDRIDGDGNYCPENCRWADRFEQGKNRRLQSTYKGKPYSAITFNGLTASKRAWSKIIGVADSVVTNRLRAGWSVEQALTIPKIKHGYCRTGKASRKDDTCASGGVS